MCGCVKGQRGGDGTHGDEQRRLTAKQFHVWLRAFLRGLCVPVQVNWPSFWAWVRIICVHFWKMFTNSKLGSQYSCLLSIFNAESEGQSWQHWKSSVQKHPHCVALLCGRAHGSFTWKQVWNTAALVSATSQEKGGVYNTNTVGHGWGETNLDCD